MDLIVLAGKIVTGLTEIPRRDLDPLKQQAVVTATQIHGGHAFNVIPSEVRICGTVRTLDLETRQQLCGQMEALCRDLAALYRAEVTWALTPGPPLLINDAALAGRASDLLTEMLGSQRVVSIDYPSLGSEDFSRFTESVPGLLLRLGCTTPGQVPHPLHSSHFRVDGCQHCDR